MLGSKAYSLYAYLALAIIFAKSQLVAGALSSSVHCGLAATHVGRIAENSHMDIKVFFA